MPKPGGTSARGYGPAHQRERTKWAPLVEAGQVECHAITCVMTDRWIPPGSAWDLGHTEDRSAWTGPEHRRCNRADGGRRRHRGGAGRKFSDSGPKTPAVFSSRRVRVWDI